MTPAAPPGSDAVPYRSIGRVRQIAYAGILSLAAAGSAGGAWLLGPWGAAPACLATYLLAYLLHEHALWRAWRRWHAVPDLTGRWRHGDDLLVVHQTWTRLWITGSIGGQGVVCRLAGWFDRPAGLRVVLTTATDPALVAHLRLGGDGELMLTSPVDAFPPLRWHRGGSCDPDLPA